MSGLPWRWSCPVTARGNASSAEKSHLVNELHHGLDLWICIQWHKSGGTSGINGTETGGTSSINRVVRAR
eukprot:1475552-Pleurochrysis_carterae.AAC.1